MSMIDTGHSALLDLGHGSVHTALVTLDADATVRRGHVVARLA